MADHQPRPDTEEFPAVVDSPQAQLGSALSVGPHTDNNRATAITLGLLLVLLLIIIGAAVSLVLSLGGGAADSAADPPADSATAPPAPSTAEPTSKQAAEGTQTETPVESPAPPASRPSQPELPAGSTPANDAARDNIPAGDLNNVYTGTASTSAEFALEVRDEFVRNYLDTGELTGRIQATSPITGQTYEMSCSDSNGFITCSGGNNAVIYIA